MDSEHRHQLQKNDLAQASMKMASFFEVHGTKIVGAIAVLVVAAIIWAVWANSANDSQVEAWTALSTAIQSNEPSAETFGSVADRFADRSHVPNKDPVVVSARSFRVQVRGDCVSG